MDENNSQYPMQAICAICCFKAADMHAYDVRQPWGRRSLPVDMVSTLCYFSSMCWFSSTTTMTLTGLSRRERQVMEILYQKGKTSASGIREAMEDPPTYSAVRALLRVLEQKGHIEHVNEGLKYVYTPVINRDKAKRSAVKHLVDTFFRDAPEQVVAALLDVSSKRLSRKELDRMADMIEKARKEGR
jgi:BlaI family transcriptional regulator, penicillinase repressor